MKTNILKPIRWWTLVLCCALLSAARAQDVETPAAGKDATIQAPDSGSGEAKRGVGSQQEAGSQKSGDAPQDDDRSEHTAPSDDDASRSSTPSDEDDEWTSQADTGSTGAQRHRHRHHDGSDDAVVSIGHKAELPAGQHAESVVAIFGAAISAGDVDSGVVSVLGNTRVTGKVGDGAVAVLGSVYVNGEVDGDVVAILGNVELGPQARVRGNVVIVGGELTRDPSATVDGHVQTVFTTDWAGFDWVRPWIERCLLYGRPLAFAPGIDWAWGIALGMLALYVFIAFVFRGAVEHCVHTFESKPGHSILAALLAMLLTPVLFVLLFVTVLGIAAIPFLAFALLCAAAFGKVVILASIGRRCTPMLAHDPVMHTVAGVAVGGAIVLVLYTIPFIGFAVYKLLGILGFGVVVYTLLVAVRSGRQARAAARNGGLGPNGGAGPGGGAGVGGGAGRVVVRVQVVADGRVVARTLAVLVRREALVSPRVRAWRAAQCPVVRLRRRTTQVWQGVPGQRGARTVLQIVAQKQVLVHLRVPARPVTMLGLSQMRVRLTRPAFGLAGRWVRARSVAVRRSEAPGRSLVIRRRRGRDRLVVVSQRSGLAQSAAARRQWDPTLPVVVRRQWDLALAVGVRREWDLALRVVVSRERIRLGRWRRAVSRFQWHRIRFSRCLPSGRDCGCRVQRPPRVRRFQRAIGAASGCICLVIKFPRREFSRGWFCLRCADGVDCVDDITATRRLLHSHGRVTVGRGAGRNSPSPGS